MRTRIRDFNDLLRDIKRLEGKINMFYRIEPWFPCMLPPPLGTYTYGQKPKEALPDGAKVFRDARAMIDSMTPDERALKVPLSESRRMQIARGSGVLPGQVDALERQMSLLRNRSKRRQ